MAFTVTERQAWTGSLSSGTTIATGSFAATGGGMLMIASTCGSDSSIAFADPSSVTGHGGTFSIFDTGQSVQSADPSANFSVWRSTDYTAGSAAVTTTWGTTSGLRATYAVEVTAGSAITFSFAKSFESAAAGATVTGHMLDGVGDFFIQFVNSWNTSLTFIPYAHTQANEIEDASNNAVTNISVSHCAGLIAHPTVGGLLSGSAVWWCGIGVVLYEGSAPSAPVRTNGVGARTTSGTTAPVYADPNSAAPRDGTNKDIMARVVKPETATFTDTSDFSEHADLDGGTGTTGVDVGQTGIHVEHRDLGSGDTGSVTTAIGNTPNSVTGARFFIEKDSGTWDVLVASHNKATHNNGRTASGSTPSEDMALAPGDIVYALCASDTDATTPFGSAAITASGITFGVTQERLGAGGAGTGNDSGFYLYEAIVSSGTATAQVVLTLTTGPTNCGRTVFLRYRAVVSGADTPWMRVPGRSCWPRVPLMARRARS